MGVSSVVLPRFELRLQGTLSNPHCIAGKICGPSRLEKDVIGCRERNAFQQAGQHLTVEILWIVSLDIEILRHQRRLRSEFWQSTILFRVVKSRLQRIDVTSGYGQRTEMNELTQVSVSERKSTSETPKLALFREGLHIVPMYRYLESLRQITSPYCSKDGLNAPLTGVNTIRQLIVRVISSKVCVALRVCQLGNVLNHYVARKYNFEPTLMTALS
ncbi:hypothetical protein EDD85DRAFT_935713 [Armillaria nabsnona]|nr:hypothetical protein EDD85DRAFT_935713 [Armillaria nabsnona]